MIDGIKNILVGITEEGTDEASAALGYALSLAQKAKAHLTVQATSVRISLHHAVASEFATNLIEAENRRLRALADQVAERSRADSSAAGVTCTVESRQLGYGELLEHFVAQARVNDLAVLDAETATIDVDRGLIEATLFDSGHPVILVPSTARSFGCGRIVVGWDGSAQAARAVSGALPLLRAADAVDLVSVVPEKELSRKLPGADAATFLARHGVAVTETDLAIGVDGVARTMLRFLERHHAELLVMGAYKHSMAWEWLTGGVTQTFLKTNPLPLFLSH